MPKLPKSKINISITTFCSCDIEVRKTKADEYDDEYFEINIDLPDGSWMVKEFFGLKAKQKAITYYKVIRALIRKKPITSKELQKRGFYWY